MPVCGQCGQENPEGARFCNECAAPLTAELETLVENATISTRWLDAARAYVAGAFVEAADVHAEIGALSDEAFDRLRAAEALVDAGRRADADVQLQRALTFYRSVSATAYIRDAEDLLAASA
jgi:hypothetical protein